MVGMRRIVMAVALALTSLGSIAAVPLATATPSAANTCTISWASGVSGNWNSSALWSPARVPTSTDVVCIYASGTYTVDLTGSATVSAVQVSDGASGTQTLKVDGSSTNVDLSVGAASSVGSTGVLALNSSSSGGYSNISGAGGVTVTSGGVLSTSLTGTSVPAYIETPVTNQAGGTVTIGAPDTRQDSNTLTTNSGAFSVASSAKLSITGGSSFTDAAGSLTLTGTMSETGGTFTQSGGTESGNPVDLNDVVLADSAGTGSFDDIGSGGSVTGTIPVGQTVTVDGRVTNVSLTVTGVTDDGTLALTSNSAGGYAQITGSGSGLTVASGGQLTTSLASVGSVPCYIETPLTNQTGGTVTIGAPDTRQDSNTLTTNSGAFSVASGGKLSVTGGSSFTDAAGTLAVTGTMTQTGGTFTQSGGTESGNPVDLNDVAFADSAGTGSFDDIGSGGTLTGSIPVGQTVTVDGRVTNVSLAVTGVTDDGTLALTSNSSGGYAQITGSGSGLTVASGAHLSTSLASVSSVPVYIETPLTIQTGGTVTIGAPDTRQDENTLTTNSGAFSVASGGKLAISGGSSFTDAAGTVTVTGTMTQTGGTFTQSGGTESGNPVDLNDVAFADSAGTGSFDDIGSGSTLTGSIPVGQTVTVDGRVTNVALTVTGVTDHGTLALASNSSGGWADITGSGLGLTVASGAHLSTSWTGSSAPVYIETPLTNQTGGTVTIGAPDTRQDSNTLTTNAGTLQVLNGGHLTVSGGSTLTNTGTLGVTVNGTAGGISGPGVTVTGSTLAVTTVGSQPTAGTVFTPITGPVTGTFSTLVFGANAYAVTYPSGVVALTAENPFTLAPTAFTPLENEPTGAVQVASIGNANDDSGTYSATVNYGDGRGNQTATVVTTGATGTVTGPSHTYATNGTYTVTVTVANTNGTTITTTENVTVGGPIITGFSKTSVKQGKKLTTKVSGTGFDTSANLTSAWTTSNPGITITSAKLGKVTRAHPIPAITLKLKASATAALGPVSVTLTEDTGSYTFPNAFTVIAS
jgi:hypothetical protein